MIRAQTKAQNELDEQLSRQRQAIQVSLAALRSLRRFILELRGRIRRGLRKVEQLHALTGTCFYGRRGLPSPSGPQLLTKILESVSLFCKPISKLTQDTTARWTRSRAAMRRSTSSSGCHSWRVMNPGPDQEMKAGRIQTPASTLVARRTVSSTPM